METTERTTKGLTFTMDSELGQVCVYDAEGVRVHTRDRIEQVVVQDRTRRFGTVVCVTVDWLSVQWDDCPGTHPVTVDVFENFCRVVLEETVPTGYFEAQDEQDERELVPDFDEACENVRECGGF